MPLEIQITHGDVGTYKVTLSGSLDSETYTLLERAMEPAMADPDARAIRLEIQELRFISSLGIGTIVKLRKNMHAKGGVVTLIGAQPQVAKVFEILRVLPQEVVFATREEADTYLAMIQQKVLDEQAGRQPAF